MITVRVTQEGERVMKKGDDQDGFDVLAAVPCC